MIVFWLLCAVGLYFLVGLFVVPPLAEAKLRQLSGGAVDIESGRFKGLFAIRLNGVIVSDENRTLLEAPALQADRVEVQFQPWQLLRGHLKIHSVLLEDVLLTADYNPAVRKWNLGNFSFQQSTSSKQTSVPLIIIEQGALRVRRTGPDRTEILTTASINGRIAEKTDKNEYAFSLETDGRFGYGSSSLVGGVRFGQDGEKNQFWTTGQIQMPSSDVLQNRWNLRDIKLDCTYDQEAVTVRQLSFSIGDGRADINGLFHRDGGHAFELNMDCRDFEIAEQRQSNSIVYGRFNEFSKSGLVRFLGRFHPVGKGNAALSIQGRLDDLSEVFLNGTIHCEDISICDDRFPYRLEKMQGEIQFTDRIIQLGPLQSEHGAVQVQVSGQVGNPGPGESIDIKINSSNMRFDDDLYNALSESAQKVWFEFSPTGLTAVDYHFHRSPDGQKAMTLTLNLDKAGAVYKHFPYPMENLTGEITVESERLQFKDVHAFYADGRSIRVDGQVFRLDGSEPVFHVSIQGERIPFDKRLIKAMPAKQQRLFDPLQAEASASFKVDVFPNQTNRRNLDYTADIQIDAKTFRDERFPLPMNDAKLEATVTQDVVLVKHFEAQTACGPVRIFESQLWPQGNDPNQPGLCLNLEMKDFELNDLFWKAAGADANELLGDLRVFGSVGVTGRLAVNSPSALCSSNDLIVDCAANPLWWDGAEIGTANGRVLIENDTIAFADFNLKEIPLEALPPNRIPFGTQVLYAGIEPKGFADVSIRKGFLQTASEGLLRMDVDAGITLKNISFEKAEAIHGLSGTCEGRFAVDTQEGTWQTQARYDISRLYYNQWHVNDLRGSLVYDPNTRQLHSNDLQASFYCADGLCSDDQVKGTFAVTWDPQKQAGYELELNYKNVDTQKLIVAARDITQEQSAEGLASGSLVLVGNLNELSNPRGKFSAQILDMKLGQQSMLGKVLTAVQLKRPENFVFNEIDLSADVRGSELIFDQVRMVGDPLVFHGKGTVDLKSRQIAMELASWDRIVRGEDSVLDSLIRGIGSALWKVEIYGDLDAPEVNAVFLSMLKQPLDVFKKNEQ